MVNGDTGSSRAWREFNRQRVVELLRREGAMSRAEIARRLSLAPTTAYTLVSELVADALVEEWSGAPAAGQRGPGRPARLVRLAPGRGVVAGIDVGRTHLRVAVADRTLALLGEEETALALDHRAAQTVERAVEVLRAVLADAGRDPGDLLAVGLGIPGPVESATGTVGPGAILPAWVSYDAGAALRELLGVPVAVENDANLGVLAEAAMGAARGARDAVYVKISWGIGAGILVGGTLYRGSGGTAGELGHLPVVPDGLVCQCGSRGCLETVASTRAVVAQLAGALDAPVTVEDVVARAVAGDPTCRRVVEDAGHHVGRALGVLANLLDPEVIVLGGPMAHAGEVLTDAVQAALRRSSIPSTWGRVQVRLSQLEDRAQVLGAVAVAGELAPPLGAPAGPVAETVTE